jgi:hypothetical protein
VEGSYQIEDTQKKMPCGWTRTRDGKVRCLPSAAVLYPVQFSDPNCSQPIHVITRPACGEPPGYLLTQTEPPTCPGSFGLRARGTKLDLRAFYHRAPDGTCESSPRPLSPTQDAYAIGDELPLEDFVAATRADPTPGAYAQSYLDAEDGGRWVAGFSDPTGTICFFGTAADGLTRCLPRTTFPYSAYGDAACSTRVALGWLSSCPVEQLFVHRGVPSGCGTRYSVFRAGARLSGAYGSDPRSCQAIEEAAYLDIVSLGDEIGPAAFTPGTYGVLDGPGRLKRATLTTVAGTFATGSLWDAKLGVYCSQSLLADGTERCVPFGRFDIANFYADADCSLPLAWGRPGCGGLYALRTEPGTCPVAHRVFELAPQPHRSAVYLKSSTACTKMDISGFTSELRGLGAELPPDAFVELRLEP